MATQAGHFFDKETARIWDLIGRLDEPDLHKPIRDDGWSSFMILAHMAISSRGLLTLARRQYAAHKSGAAFELPAGFDVNHNNEQAVADWQGKSLAEVRESWDETGRRFQEFVAGLSEDDLALPARFVTGQPMTLGQLVSLITGHLRQHRQELEAGLAALAD